MRVKIYTLGTCRFFKDDEEVELICSHRKAFGVLFLLAISPKNELPITKICDTLWEGADRESAISNLFANVNFLRKRLGFTKRELFVARGVCRLRVDEVYVDILDFDEKLKKALNSLDPRVKEHLLLQTKELVVGEFLPSFLDEEWTVPFREEYREKYLVVLEELVKLYTEREDLQKVSEYAKELLREDPYNEAAIFHLCKALMKCGKFSRAKEVYEKRNERFREELGIGLSFSFSDLLKETKTMEKGAMLVEDDVFEKYLNLSKDGLLVVIRLKDLGDLPIKLRERIAKMFRKEDVICFERENVKIILHHPVHDDISKLLENVVSRLKGFVEIERWEAKKLSGQENLL